MKLRAFFQRVIGMQHKPIHDSTTRPPVEPKRPSAVGTAHDTVKSVMDKATQSAINISSWRPLDAEPPTPITNSTPLESLNIGLTTDVNRVNSLLEQAKMEPDKARKNYLEAATLSSKMLQQILGNEHFRRGIRQLAKARTEHEGKFFGTMTDWISLEEFLTNEYELLKANNVPMADILISEGRKIIKDIEDGKAPPQTIYVAIERLRRVTSGLRGDLEKETSKINRERAVKILKKAALGISASAVAIVNVQAEATLTAPLAALSGHMAAGIIGAAATDAWSLFTGSGQ